MNGCVVQVWFEPESEYAGGRAKYKYIETGFPNFESFCKAVASNELIPGNTLWIRRQNNTETLVMKRYPCIFRGSAVLRCELPRWRFVEYEDA